jgi:hypothetical protein
MMAANDPVRAQFVAMTDDMVQQGSAVLRNWKIRTLLILLLLAVLLAVRIRQGQLSRAEFAAEFAAIQPGMTHDEVERRLGKKPGYQKMMLGKVISPTSFASNSNPLPKDRHRYQQYDFQQWTTSELTVMIVFDLEGRVVCRYSSAGQTSWPRSLSDLVRIF